MGADQNLIRAAAQMAPKPFDYSGIMKAIAAIGKYTAVKNSVASELYAYGDKNISAKDMTKQLFVGDYGDQNMNFISDAKKQWNNASNDIKKYPAFSKKYKTAVKTINNIKTMFEKNKADLVLFEQISKESSIKNLNKSRGITSVAENRLLDIVLDKETNRMSGSLLFTNQGVGVLGSDDQFISVRELMDGYQANLVDEKVDKKVKNLINEFGYASANSGQPEFLEAKAKAAIASLVKEMGKNGFAGIRSLAYDLEYNGETFMTSENNLVKTLGMTSDQFNADIDAKNPGLSDKEKIIMRDHTLADAYTYKEEDTLQQGFEDWLLGVVKNDFNETQSAPKIKGEGKIALNSVLNKDNSTMRADKSELATAVKNIKDKKSFGVDGTIFAWDEKAGQWKYQKGKLMVPVPSDPANPGKDGSVEAMLFIWNYNSSIANALGINTSSNTQVEGDNTLQVFENKTDSIIN